MSEKSGFKPVTSKLRRYLIRLFQIFILICLVDGFLDIVYPPLSGIKKNINTAITEIKKRSMPMAVNESRKDIVPPSDIPLRELPGIKNIVSEYHSKSINVNAEGLRDNGQEAPAKVKHVGFLLGASSAFGYGTADNQSIAAYLERALSDTAIRNYAGLGQPVPDNILRLYELQKKHGKPDFVIIAGINYQLYKDCWPIPKPTSTERSSIFPHLAEKLVIALSNEKVRRCASSEGMDLAVRNSVMAVENAVTFSRKNDIPFYIINLPTPYDANVNTGNLQQLAGADYIPFMRSVFSRHRDELAKLDMAEFIDISDALPPEKMYFMDFGGHLTSEGNRIIAEKIFSHIWGDKHQAPRRSLQQGDTIPRAR